MAPWRRRWQAWQGFCIDLSRRWLVDVGSSGFRVCTSVYTVGLLNRFCAPSLPSGDLVEAAGVDVARWCVRSGHVAPIMTTHFIKFVDGTFIVRQVAFG